MENANPMTLQTKRVRPETSTLRICPSASLNTFRIKWDVNRSAWILLANHFIWLCLFSLPLLIDSEFPSFALDVTIVSPMDPSLSLCSCFPLWGRQQKRKNLKKNKNKNRKQNKEHEHRNPCAAGAQITRQLFFLSALMLLSEATVSSVRCPFMHALRTNQRWMA